MTRFQNLLSAVKLGRAKSPWRAVSNEALNAQYRFRHSMIGEPGIHEAARLFGVGR